MYLLPTYVITEHQAECPVLSSRFSPAFCFTHGSAHTSCLGFVELLESVGIQFLSTLQDFQLFFSNICFFFFPFFTLFSVETNSKCLYTMVHEVVPLLTDAFYFFQYFFSILFKTIPIAISSSSVIFLNLISNLIFRNLNEKYNRIKTFKTSTLTNHSSNSLQSC